MQKSPFIWLGSGRARRRGVARKGQLLDQAARLGLPVPSGGILLEDFYHICLAEGVIELAGSKVVVPDPVWLQQVLFRDVRFPHLQKEVVVRPAASSDSRAGEQMKRAQLGVDLDDAEQLAGALRLLWSRENRKGQAHDVLIMEMVAVEMSGEAITDKEQDQDMIQINSGPSELLASTFSLQQIGTFQRASRDALPFARRLQKLLRGVRRSFGKGRWRVDWADDASICWLLQIQERVPKGL